MSSYYEKFLATGEVKCIDEEIPFDLPLGWEWCRLCYVAEVARGGSPRPIKDYITESPSGINWIKIGDTEKGGKFIFSTRERIKPEGMSKSRFVHKGDFLLTNSMSFGRPYITQVEGCIHDGWLVISLIGGAYCQDFLYYLLSSNFAYAQFSSKVAGAVVQNLNSDKVANSLFPIPPKTEQEKIVQKIKSILPKVHQYEELSNELTSINIAIHSKLKKSILQDAIQGKLVPQIEEEGTAQELLEQIKFEKQKLVKEGKIKKSALNDSIIFRGDDNKYYEQTNGQVAQIECDYDFPNNWAVTRLSSICTLVDGEKKDGQQICLDAKYLRGKSAGDYLQRGRFVQKGDNIILVDGENSGEVFTVPCDGYMGSTFKQLWFSSVMHLPYVLNYILFYKELLRKSKRGAAIPHLNKEIFYSLIIGIPPHQEQIRIVNKINEIYSKIKA